MLLITANVSLADNEIELTAIRAQGSGGQNVNKVSSVIHLRFDVKASSLPDFYKERLLSMNDQRINKEGVIIIKAQKYRTQEQNREDALARLAEVIQEATLIQTTRKPTRPTRSSRKKRLETKSHRARSKALRGKPRDD